MTLSWITESKLFQSLKDNMIKELSLPDDTLTGEDKDPLFILHVIVVMATCSTILVVVMKRCNP